MAKITDKADLTVGVELIVDEPNREYELLEAGNLVAKDGVTWRAFYSKFVDLWATATYQDSPFPLNSIDPLSGQYQVGVDAGGNANGWKPKNESTRNILRDGGSTEFNDSGDTVRINVGIVGLGELNVGAQPYYILDPADPPTDFVFDDQANAQVQVFGDTANGNFDKRSFFKGFVREEGFKYTDSTLDDTAKDSSGAFIVNLLLSNDPDDRITTPFSNINTSPYTGVTVEYFTSPQQRDVGGTNYPYSIIVSNDEGATLEQVHTKLQYLLQLDSDINEGGSVVLGKTADLLGTFAGDTYNTELGVYIDDVLPEDSNRVTFKDDNGDVQVNPFESAGVLSFNQPMTVSISSSYRLFFTSPAGAGNDFGEAGAITVQDAQGVDITGSIDSTSIPFTFDYDNDTLGGPAGTDKPVTLIGISPGSTKYAVATGVLTKSKGISLSLQAEADRAYE